MDKDWPRLIQVRDRQKADAMEALAGARQAAAHAAARCGEARHALASRLGERSGSWEGTLGRFASGTLDVEQLRRAGGFDAVTSRRIAQAHEQHDAARACWQQAQARAEQAHGWLRNRCAALEKAECMDERARVALRKREEQRAEEGAETAALTAWLSRPGRHET